MTRCKQVAGKLMKPPIRLLMIIGLLAGLQHVSAQVIFAPVATNGVGVNPWSITAADVNGDGKMNLICANVGDNTLSVLTNNGSGGFVLSGTNGVGNGAPLFVLVADVNGDGKPDLICANYYGDNLKVLTNNGSGGFVIACTNNVGAGPRWVTAADVNGDGKMDLISANQGYGSGNTLTVLTNNGSGGFVTASSPVVGSQPVSVTAADVNGDGKMDLICANYNGNTLTVLTNNGSGGFVISSSPRVGTTPYSVVAADVNGDGRLDLVCANSGDNTLTVLTNNGSGGFVTACTNDVGAVPYSVVAADVNGDGRLDLICVNHDASTLTVLTNATTFPPPASTPSLTINLQSNGMRVAWPSASAGWSLQQSPDLTTAHWGPGGYSGYTVFDDGTNKSLIIPSQPGNLFFRLLHP